MIQTETKLPLDHFTGDHVFLVNPVNLEGVMGAGVARWFKTKYPVMADLYRYFCEKGKIHVGSFFLWSTPSVNVVNLPTKITWRSNSSVATIERGLQALDHYLLDCPQAMVVMPRIGAGLGRLNWARDVRPLVDRCRFNTTVATGYMSVDDVESSNDELFASYLILSNAIINNGFEYSRRNTLMLI